MINKYSLKYNGNENISEHFKVREFACKDGSDMILVDTTLICILENVRKMIKAPINIVSGYRNVNYNTKINGAKDSFHTKGQACDIKSNCDLETLAIASAMCGARGVGVYHKSGFVHIDTRDIPKIFKGD